MPAWDFIASTPDQARLWEGCVTSNPYRVIRALALGFQDSPNPWGDTLTVSSLDMRFLWKICLHESGLQI
jgi:hypothetical protein